MIFQLVDIAGPGLFHQAVDDLDPRQITLVHRAVKGLPGESLLMDGAVRIAVEITAEFVFQLADADLGLRYQGPGQILIVKPFAAFDRVHEMAFGAVTRGKRHVVAALHHAGAAGFPQQPLDRHGHLQLRRQVLGVQGREQARPARTQDQNIRLLCVDPGRHDFTPMAANASARRSSAVFLTPS